MSSFEPLLRGTRLTPRASPAITSVGAWTPVHVSSPIESRPSLFDEELEDVHATMAAAAHAAASTALAAARQGELDAAYLRGVCDGRDQAGRSESARLRSAMLASETALDDLRAGETRWLAHLEENIAAIAVAIAQQIVAREVSTSVDIVRSLVARALDEFALDQALTIRVSPADLALLHSAGHADDASVAVDTHNRDVRWVADARIESGGCVVEGRERIVDGRIDTALERLYRRLTHTNA
jgi:flagellar assembly protein FliH